MFIYSILFKSKRFKTLTNMINNYLSSLTGGSLIQTNHNLISQVTGPNNQNTTALYV